MGTSARINFTCRATRRASGLRFRSVLPGVLAGGLAFACSGHDTSYVDPTGVDINPPGFGGDSGHLDSNGGSSGEGGSAGEAGAAGTSDGGTGGTENPPEPAACTIAFVTPTPGAAHTLGPADDQDGTPCGAAFTTNVVVSSSGAAVTLFVDGTPWATKSVTDSTGTFNSVVLGSRTPSTSTLRAVATMDDGRTCEATLDPLGVDCEGPSCQLTGPTNAAWLTVDNDENSGTAGLQTHFTVQTEADNAGQSTHLILNGNENALLSADVQNDGVATFSNVTLAEGPSRSVQAECRDASGNVTRSSIASWSVTLAECQVAFTLPDPGSDPITLGPADDQDGTPCGAEFATHVNVTSNAATLTLLVDGQPVQSNVPVVDGVVDFPSVLLGTRIPSSSTLTVTATMTDGRNCSATRESLIVDCEGPTCTLVGPSQNPYLNSGDDLAPGTPDLQADFSVTTNVENIGQSVKLIIDDDTAHASTAVVADDNGVATAPFDSTTLAEGPVRKVQAECEDALGNITRSAPATWGVDITACGISIGSVAGGANPITRAIDESNLTTDIQVTALGAVTGTDCTGGVRVGVCTQPLGTFSPDIVDQNNDWSTLVTLADLSGSGEVCAQVKDTAGNIAEVRTPVNVRSNDPVVAFSSPSADANINALGTAGAIADATPGGPSCEATFVVDCTELNSNVHLFVDNSEVDAQPCTGVGQATFNRSLATQNGGEKYSLTASQTVAGLTGTSAAILIGADCDPPVPTFASPLCNSQLNVDTDDSQLGSPGVQHDVTVNNGGVPHVTLTVGNASPLAGDGDQTSTTFADVSFGDPGAVTMSASVTDAQGNVGTVSCQVQVVEAPTVDILVPGAPTPPATATLLSTAADCDAGSGYGITVSGTTSALAGSTVEVDIDGGLPFAFADVVDGGGGPNTFTGCLPIADGANQIVTVTIDDGVNPVGSDSTAVTVDTLAPTDAIVASVNIVGRRADFTWSHVNDTGGGLLASYEMRCSDSQILTETDWDNARIRTLTTVPAAAGQPDATETVGTFRPEVTENCVIRGRDQIDKLTPLAGAPGNVAVHPTFSSTTFTSISNPNSTFTNVVALGDINGDGSDDMLYGATNLGAQIYFGGSSAHPFDTTPDVTFTGLATGAFGAVIANVGDINDDGVADFAISARALTTNSGKVFLFFGKKTDTWSSTVDVTTGGCGADVCLVGSAINRFFGWDMTGTNFDGVGGDDLVIGARANNIGGNGVVYVIRDSQLSAGGGITINVPSGNPDGFQIDAPSGNNLFGTSVAAVGNGPDNKGDLAMGALGTSGGNSGSLFYLKGEAYTALPGTGLQAPSASPVSLVASGSGGDFASNVHAAGDFDGDGLGDLVLARNFSAGTGLGIAELYLRNNGIFPVDFSSGGGYAVQFPATGTDSDFGNFLGQGLYPKLGAFGDLDNDGATELLVGSNIDTVTPAGGSVALFYSPRPPVLPATTRTVTSRTRAEADFTVAGSATTSLMIPNFVGDIDHDGFKDIAIIDGGSGVDKLILLH